MKKQIFSALKIIALALVLSFGISYVYAWTTPTATPPGGNVAAPINTSGTAQTKTGNLTAGNLTAISTSTANKAVVAPKYCIGANCITAWPTGGDNLGNHIASTTLNMNNNTLWGAGQISVDSFIASTSITTWGPISNPTFYAGPTAGSGISTNGGAYVSGNVRANDYWIESMQMWASDIVKNPDAPGTICGYATNGCGWAGSARCKGLDPYCGACPAGYTLNHWLTNMGDHHLYFCMKN